MTLTIRRMILVNCILLLQSTAVAFTALSTSKAGIRKLANVNTIRVGQGNGLRMSDIPKEPDHNKNRKDSSKIIIDVQKEIMKYEKEIAKNLPPRPEDMIVLTGDLLSLSVYGF
jgi:hypothetical protein